jgi:hypothetical protein
MSLQLFNNNINKMASAKKNVRFATLHTSNVIFLIIGVVMIKLMP